MDIKKILKLVEEGRLDEIKQLLSENQYKDFATQRWEEITAPERIEAMKSLIDRWNVIDKKNQNKEQK